MKKKFFALPYIVWMILFTVVPLILVFIYAFVDMTDTGNIVITLEYIKTAFSGDNIAVWSPFKLWDPELSWNSFPLQRTFNVGVQFNL